MARPIKKEPDYFPLDTDLLSNRKIRQIKRKYGSDAFHYILPCFVTSMPMAIISRPTRKSVSLPSSARYSSNTRPVTHWNVSTPPMSTNPCKSGDWSTTPPEEKRHAMSLFAHWRPPGHLPISEDYRLTMVRQQAMAWLLRRYFDGPITEEKAKRTISFGD